MSNLMQNLGTKIGAEFKAHRLRIETVESIKVDKISGKGLSTEDYTTAEKTKLAGVEAGAQVNTVISVAGKTGEVSLAKSDVGLENVNNTADVNKSVLSATKLATARTINGVSFDGTANIIINDSTKEPSITAGTTAQYWRGDKTWATMPTSLPASDVSAWAKAATKPTYIYSEVGAPSTTGGNASGTWGISITGNAATATTATNATKLNGQNWYWSGQGGQPTWLWGGSDGTNMYVYNPSNFHVNYANSAGSANSVSASAVASGTAGLDAGWVGTYGFFFTYDGASPGTTVSGSRLRWSSTSSGSNGYGTPTGTWKSMGYAYETKTLFLRIA